ncbi:thiazole tautomerase TenI [Tenuibacillus multivorans]|uniref:Thiazole tautomerase (Transcriptional regulator TenI) n=1 Tax=Tenuibacillus multivorans TaxID=237069 RepID=A0A1H0DYR0_9BACI|nr:thiazole tautomerase TenI [Tenuibacillus multivorans]GEL76722.1 thiamine phosphate synthase [Tenuibacillus multivorans]SDN75282.1 thiazole tautomerase (transcriptional regulator TenI) [Tenuibacillus multivorans]
MGEIHLISNGKWSLHEFADVASNCITEIDYVHLREKNRTDEELETGVDHLINAGIPTSKIMINDRVSVASHKQVRGVQLAYHSLDVKTVRQHYPDLRIGRSVHSVVEAKKAEQDGADYVLYGHIFKSNSKPGLKPRGLENLKNLIEQVSIPVIAIGGITPHNANKVMECGAHGIAVMSGILESENPKKVTQHYRGGVSR